MIRSGLTAVIRQGSKCTDKPTLRQSATQNEGSVWVRVGIYKCSILSSDLGKLFQVLQANLNLICYPQVSENLPYLWLSVDFNLFVTSHLHDGLPAFTIFFEQYFRPSLGYTIFFHVCAILCLCTKFSSVILLVCNFCLTYSILLWSRKSTHFLSVGMIGLTEIFFEKLILCMFPRSDGIERLLWKSVLLRIVTSFSWPLKEGICIKYYVESFKA